MTAIHPVTADRWDDLAAVLGPSGGDGGCWDMFWRLTATEYAASSRARNRGLLRELVEGGEVPAGLLAYRDGEPAGWVSVGPRTAYRRPRTAIRAALRKVVTPIDPYPAILPAVAVLPIRSRP